MFLEKIDSLLKVPYIYLFFSSFLFSFLGIYIASLIFRSNVGLVSVFIVSIAIMPVVNRTLGLTFEVAERKREIVKGNVTLTEFSLKGEKLNPAILLADYRELFLAYGAVFSGVFIAFILMTIFLPSGSESFFLGDQLKVMQGKAFDYGFFMNILVNNLVIVAISLLFSALFELGTTFIIVWNASAWGAIFAIYAKQLAESNPLPSLLVLLAFVLPHTILEAAGYFSAAISGGITHRALAFEMIGSERSNRILVHAVILLVFAVILLVIGAFLETLVVEVAYRRFF